MYSSAPSLVTTSLDALAAGARAERRTAHRSSPEGIGLDRVARLASGAAALVIDLSSGGALVELSARLHPGTRAELRLSRSRLIARPEVTSHAGVVSRCWVHRLSPLRYRTAVVFDRRRAAAGLPRLAAGEIEIVLDAFTA